MIVIAFSGKKQSGKSTIASMIRGRLSAYKCEEIAFADPLKDDICKMFHVTRAHLEKNKTLFRPLLQWYGTDYCRHVFGDDYWIKRFAMSLYKTDTEIVLVPDVRFLNEARVIKEIGGVLVRVNRHQSADVNSVTDQHPSETEMDKFNDYDYNFRNDGSLQSLEFSVDDFIQHLKHKHILK